MLRALMRFLCMFHCFNISKHISMCMIKSFRGGGAGVETPSKPPTNNFCLYPPPILRCFWKDPLMTPTPHHPTSSTFHCYPPPHPPPLPPLKILITHHFSTVFCWIFENNCPWGGVSSPGMGISHFLCAQGVGNSPFQKIPRGFPGEGDGQAWN